MPTKPPIVSALGGNAINRKRQFGTVGQPVFNTREAKKPATASTSPP